MLSVMRFGEFFDLVLTIMFFIYRLFFFLVGLNNIGSERVNR